MSLQSLDCYELKVPLVRLETEGESKPALHGILLVTMKSIKKCEAKFQSWSFLSWPDI